MKSENKIKALAFILLFFVLVSSCRKQDDEYNYEENDEPSIALTQFDEVLNLAMSEPYPENEKLIIRKIKL